MPHSHLRASYSDERWCTMQKFSVDGLALVILLLLFSGCTGRKSSVDPVATTPPSIRATIDLGVIIQGKSCAMNRWIRNDGDHPIHIVKIDKSCDCLDIRLSRSQLAPGERTLAYCSYDGSHELDFVGSLAIVVTLYDKKGSELGVINVPIEVVRDLDIPRS